MAGSITTTPPSAPNHYIVVVHGIGEQKLNTTIPPVIHRFAEVRQNRDERYYEIVLPATQSSQSVRSENEEHGWAEYRGIPVQDKESQEEFDGTPPTNTAGENFRFVELYWQNILQRHQEKFASETEDWVKAMLNRLTDSAITPKEWVPSWGIPMLESIANMAVPLKKMLAFKYASATELIFNGYLGDVHLYGDYARTRGESVRHFHTELDRIIFFDFLDWRKRELDAGLLVPGRYQKPEITIIAHSLGSVMSFDALVYAFGLSASAVFFFVPAFSRRPWEQDHHRDPAGDHFPYSMVEKRKSFQRGFSPDRILRDHGPSDRFHKYFFGKSACRSDGNPRLGFLAGGSFPYRGPRDLVLSFKDPLASSADLFLSPLGDRSSGTLAVALSGALCFHGRFSVVFSKAARQGALHVAYDLCGNAFPGARF